MVLRTKEDIHDEIMDRFQNRAKELIEEGSMIDLYTTILAEIGEEIYYEIDRNRTPHIWSSLEGTQLDDTGVMLNIPRKEGESDQTYRYRLMNWTLSNESANTTAISDALLNPIYASNIEFRPKVHGCGTGVCYVIPREYTNEYIHNSLVEAKMIVEKIASPGLYVEYIIPRVIGVKLQIYIRSENGDLPTIKSELESKILEYINNLAPYEYLQVGQINKIGILEDMVDYFNVLSVILDGATTSSLSIKQGIDTKLLYDEIIWVGDE